MSARTRRVGHVPDRSKRSAKRDYAPRHVNIASLTFSPRCHGLLVLSLSRTPQKRNSIVIPQTFADVGIELPHGRAGEIDTTCPQVQPHAQEALATSVCPSTPSTGSGSVITVAGLGAWAGTASATAHASAIGLQRLHPHGSTPTPNRHLAALTGGGHRSGLPTAASRSPS